VSALGSRAVPLAAGLAAALAGFAVVALTTDEGGGDRAPASARTPAPPAETEPAAPPSGPHGEGRLVFTRMGCGSCHTLAAASSTGILGPALDLRLKNHTRDSLTAQILSPGADSMMPSDFGARMTDAELDALVGFLLASRGSP
jgi:mono/diheme cytochrome c family protein